MSQDDLDSYLDKMSKHGEWGDGIMLSTAVRFYGRSLIIHTTKGEQRIDASLTSLLDPMRLGLLNHDHYVSIKVIMYTNSNNIFS